MKEEVYKYYSKLEALINKLAVDWVFGWGVTTQPRGYPT